MTGLQTAIGLMSGTSLDGIDVALLRTDGEAVVERGPCLARPYAAAFRRRLQGALEAAKTIDVRSQRPGDLAEIERELTLRHAEAVRTFLDGNGLTASDIDVIGFHGQTVLHRPNAGLTVQLGDGGLLARETGIDVVYDMRANDMVHGGQGAPLIPAYHAALAAGLSGATGKAVVFVNIGGISNITFIGAGGADVPLDSGPGNTLIDQWGEAHAGIPHRNDFRPPEGPDASLEDGARTLAHVTAAAILRSARHLPERPKLYVVCGGGRLNRVIMGDLAALAETEAAEVVTAEAVDLDGDSMEAGAWAYLAVRSLRGLPLTFPGTTGVKTPVSGGVLQKHATGD